MENKYNKPEVNHKDGNKLNNNLYNLEWVTGSENMKHACANGLKQQKRGIDNEGAKLTKQDVLYIRENYIPNDPQYGARALGRKFNIAHTTLLDVVNNITYVNV